MGPTEKGAVSKAGKCAENNVSGFGKCQYFWASKWGFSWAGQALPLLSLVSISSYGILLQIQVSKQI